MARTKLTPADRMLVEVALTEFQQAGQMAEQRKQIRLQQVIASHPEAKEGPFKFEAEGEDLYLVYADEAGPFLPKEEALKEPIPITRARKKKKNAPVPPVE